MNPGHRRTCPRTGGFTLVELMIALTLGLLITGGVISVFISNKQTYRTNEGLARIQETARVAFELMAREIRETGGNPCGTPLVANVLNNPATSWWSDWAAGSLIGFNGNQSATGIVATGTGTAQRVSGTDAILIKSGTLMESLAITDHVPASAQFKLNTTAHGIADGDILMACDYKTAAIFQVTNASSTNVTIVHNSGTGTPGNCSKGLGYPTECTALGNQKQFEDGFLVKLASSFWYIGNNGRGGRSLYRLGMFGNTGTIAGGAEEIAEGVRDMQIVYLTRNSGTGNLATAYVEANDASINNDWSDSAANRVVAVRVTLALETTENLSVDSANPLQRDMIHVISLRNREIVE
ncbi:MAG: PilW family protein [Pseudomonadota bacterium]